MITYSSMTLGEVIDGMLSKAQRHRTNINVDWATLASYVNNAAKEIMVSTLPYKEWAHNNVLDVTHGTLLPQRYMSHIRCMLSEDGSPPYREARYVAPKEFYRVSDWYGQNKWAMASETRPVFTIWGEANEMNIYISPNDQWETGTAPTGYRYYGATYSGKLECYMSPPLMASETDILPIPYEFEDLLQLSALARLLARTGDYSRLDNLQRRIMAERQMAIEMFFEKRRTLKRELESFTEPVPPLVPPPPEEGELKDS